MRDFHADYIQEVNFFQPIGEQIWQNKYRYVTDTGEADATVQDTWHRVAKALAQPESGDVRNNIIHDFFNAMSGFKLLPAGRILAGAGTHRNVTLSNTFVMRAIPDSVSGIMDAAKDAALTMQMGGGLGFDFSTIRPKGMRVVGLDCAAAGPLPAMDICDAVCRMLVSSTGRGAMMATMRIDHPDIEDFVDAKMDRSRLRNFNLSVMVTDAFVAALQADQDWPLTWEGKVVSVVRASDLWNKIMQQTYAAAEPGVLFIDRINAANPLNYLETIAATNSCAEQPLPPFGTCPLASVNLAQLVVAPFTTQAAFDLDQLEKLTAVAVRMLDNALDVSKFPLPEQAAQAQAQRRIGVGVTGVADALAMLGVRYGTPEAAEMLGTWMQKVQNTAYLTSAHLAKDRGAFPQYQADKHLAQPMFERLDPDVQDAVRQFGLRNAALTSIAPTGTISMFAGNVSSGIEPIFSTSYLRSITNPDGTKAIEEVADYAAWAYTKLHDGKFSRPDAMVTALELSPSDHVRMQAAAQNWVDSGISKTVNCPENIPFAEFKQVYLDAYHAGCKGCTTYRPNKITGSVLSE